MRKLLFYTCANAPFYEYAILYPIFAINSNPDALVEIGVENYADFEKKYGYLIAYYKRHFPEQVLFHEVDFTNILPNSVRFITQPHMRAEYVYIGDIDLFVSEDILSQHLENIEKNHLDFSNILRKGSKHLSGLHFMQYDKYYPAMIPDGVDVATLNDENLLYEMMKAKGYKIPDERIVFRPVHGFHASFRQRPYLLTLTTLDRICKDVVCCTGVRDAQLYSMRRYDKKIVDFMSQIHGRDVKLRQIVQLSDMICFWECKYDSEHFKRKRKEYRKMAIIGWSVAFVLACCLLWVAMV